MNNTFLIETQQAIIGWLTPSIVWFFFLGVAVLTGLLSIVIIWHWTRYGKGVLRKIGIEILYITVTGGLIVGLFIATTKLASKLAI